MDAVRSELLSRIKQHSELMNNSAVGAALERKKYRGNWRDANEETTNNRWLEEERSSRKTALRVEMACDKFEGGRTKGPDIISLREQ